MDFRKVKNIFFSTCAVGLMALTLSSCVTNKRVEVTAPEPPAEEYTAQEMPKTTEDVQPKITAADDAVWADIQERQRQQELIRQALEEAERLEQERIEKERIEAERLEQERLEAERIEAERLEKERLEAERIAEEQRLEAERLAEEQRLAEERRLAEEAAEKEKENPLAYIIEEIKPEENSSWSLVGEDTPVNIPQGDTGDTSIKDRDKGADKILAGDVGNSGVPSWLLSPKEQETVSGGNLQVVNIYQPLEEEKEEDTVTPDDILELGSMYRSDREEEVSVKDMNKEQLIQKAVELLIQGLPYIGIGLALILVLFVIRFLKKQINPIKKTVQKEQEGVEVLADGYMVARPGQGEDPGPMGMEDDEETEELQEQNKAEAEKPEPAPEPAKEETPKEDPRVVKDEDYEDASPMYNIKAPWKPASRAPEKKDEHNDGSYKEVSDEDLTFLVPD